MNVSDYETGRSRQITLVKGMDVVKSRTCLKSLSLATTKCKKCRAEIERKDRPRKIKRFVGLQNWKRDPFVNKLAVDNILSTGKSFDVGS